MSRVEQQIREMSPCGVQITIWPCAAGFQANVKERATSGWTCVTDADPVAALVEAMRLRLSGVATRDVNGPQEPEQMDIEDAIVVAPERVLMWHPESSSLFEGAAFDCGDGLVENVTGDPLFEAHFKAGTVPVVPCRDCNDTGYFYGDADLGPCGCTATSSVDDFDELLG